MLQEEKDRRFVLIHYLEWRKVVVPGPDETVRECLAQLDTERLEQLFDKARQRANYQAIWAPRHRPASSYPLPKL